MTIEIEKPLDEFHQHEALDRTYMVINIIEENLSNHPYVKSHPEIVRLVDEALDKLNQAYQVIGSKL